MEEKKQNHYETALKALAPCGIDCARCVAYADGDVVRLSRDLKQRLIGFEKMAERTKSFSPVMENYNAFAQMLDHFSSGSCTGCRYGDSPNCLCAAKDCHKEKGVDFCFQCADYPCDQNKYPAELAQKWRANNDRMKAVGAEAFYEEQLEKPRY